MYGNDKREIYYDVSMCKDIYTKINIILLIWNWFWGMLFRIFTLLGAITLYNRNDTEDVKYWLYKCVGNMLKCTSPNKIYKKNPKAFKTDIGTIK